MKKGLCRLAETFCYELLIAGIAISAATAIIIRAAIDAIVAATIIVAGKIMYPDYHYCDNHDDPKGFTTLE